MRLFAFPGKLPSTIGVRAGRLSPCPPSPNCICSDHADGTHEVAPLRLAVAPDAGWQAARQAVLGLPRTRLVSEGPDYLHAECRSAVFGFVDDLELHLRVREGIIAVRSASRLGSSDFGVNRRRVEALRAVLVSRKVVG